MDEELEQANARLGTVLRGKYHLDRVLGVGGMAAVYVATHRNAKQFAVKLLHADLSKNADTRARFLREGYAANSVNHPGAVAVLDDDTTEDGFAFLVMELLSGKPIDELYEARGKLTPSEVIAIGTELLDVLAAAHENKIVHRDIKPANLFLTNEGRVKVLDFGIARVRDFATSGAMTMTGALLGTPAFMPPEQANGDIEQIDGLTDQWAAAATLFTLLTGHYVHEGGTAQHLMIKAATTPPRSITTVADVPPPLAYVIDRALSFDRLQRFSSCAEMKLALVQAHMQIFGRPISPMNLAGLSGQQFEALDPQRLSADVVGVGGRTVQSFVAQPTHGPHGPHASHAPLAAAEPRRDGTLPAVATTSIPGLPKRGSSRGVWIVVTMLALGAAVGVGFIVRQARIEKAKARATATLPDTTSTSAATNATASADGSGTTTTAASAQLVPTTGVATPSASDLTAPSTSVTSAGSVIAATSASAPRTPNNQAVKGARPPKNSTAAANANTPKNPAKDCNPNYTLDADGNKHFKPECF